MRSSFAADCKHGTRDFFSARIGKSLYFKTMGDGVSVGGGVPHIRLINEGYETFLRKRKERTWKSETFVLLTH